MEKVTIGKMKTVITLTMPEDTHLTSVKVAITTHATVSGVHSAGETQTGDDGEAE